MTTRPWIGVWTVCLVAALGTTMEVSAQPAAPCEQDARHRALDFWLGEWQVVDTEGQTVGTNRIEKGQGGCLIEESWTSAGGGTGQSMNFFDPADGMWRQHWVDQSGTVVHYEGGVEDGSLRYRGRHVRRDGTVTQARVVLEPIDGGRLRHLIEHSTDDGSTWTTYFEGTYVPAAQMVAMADREPAAVQPAKEAPVPSSPPTQGQPVTPQPVAAEPEAYEPEPAESAATASEPSAPSAVQNEAAQPQATRQAVQDGSQVKAVTRELEREEIPEEQAPELVMASPMVLEVVPGNVALYPENSAWSTDETAGFICDEVTLREVEVSYRIKRGKLELVVDSTVFTHRRIKKVDLLVELFDGDELVASQTVPRVRVGLNIPAHGEDGLGVAAVMEMPEGRFRELFGGQSEPIFRFTVTCPSTS